MVGDFSFSDVAHNLHQLTQYIGGLSPASTRIFGHAFYLALLANAEYWWAVASFHSHFRSCILFSFIYYHYLEIFGAQSLGLGFFKSKVSSQDIIKTLKSRSQILKPGSRGLLKCKVTILYPFSYISSTLHIARIVYNIIQITLISFKLNINHLSLPLTKNCYDLIENRKYCRLKIYIWSQSTLPILLSSP